MLNLAIIGATGLVGRECLTCLDELPLDNPLKNSIQSLRIFASKDSAGKELTCLGKNHRIEALETADFSGIDIAVFAVSSELAEIYVSKMTDAGAISVDNSSAFRYKDSVPLVVPEVNVDDIQPHHRLIANPNCSTAQLMVALAPIHQQNPIERLIVSTYQSASGAGASGELELLNETKETMQRNQFDESSFHSLEGPHPRRLAFNVIPHIDNFLENGFTREEMKVIWETKKILHAPKMQISATAVRVPVLRGHGESVTIDLKNNTSVEEIAALLNDAPGVKFDLHNYPTPLDAQHNDWTWVGRLRADTIRPKTFHLWIVSDNLRKGAAKNALQIVEKLVELHHLS